MADPRIYQVSIGDAADASRGLVAARRFLAACGKPSVDISVWVSLAPASVAGVAPLLPEEILSADIALEPDVLPDLARVLGEEPRVHNWSCVQHASAFGSALGVGTPHPSRRDWAGAMVWLDFGDDPVPEAMANGRFGRWLGELSSAGLLPESVDAPRLMDRFTAAFPPVPAKARAMPQPFEEGGVRVSARGVRVMRGDRNRYWPGACQLAIGISPVTALERAAPLFKGGGPAEFHGYYNAATLGTTGLAARLAGIGSATFVLHTSDSGDATLDEATVDALLAAAGGDLACVEWRCDWPDAVPGYNGVQLTVNGVGNLYDDNPEHLPGATAVYIAIHARGARDARAQAAQLAKRAGLRLRPAQ